MGAKTKKVHAAGKFGAKAGTRVRIRFNKVESSQRIKQLCPYCSKPGVKRESAGIWFCHKCLHRFAGPAYVLPKKN